MTRAQNDLLLLAPLKFHLTHQSRSGDAHVYGGRSRFLTEKVLKCLEAATFQGSTFGERDKLQDASRLAVTVDVGARLQATCGSAAGSRAARDALFARLDELQREAVALADRRVLLAILVAEAIAGRQRPHALLVVLVSFGFSLIWTSPPA